MPKIQITLSARQKEDLKRKVQAAVDRRMTKVFQRGALLVEKQARVYKNLFEKSSEFQDLKSSLIGQFGFTPEEVIRLDRILELMIPRNNDITLSQIKSIRGQDKFLLLQWVDYEKLKLHPYARHELTRLDPLGGILEVTDVVSWIEWLEEGVSIVGYQFFRPNRGNIKLSRSGEGLMRKRSGSTFILEPSRIFEKIRQQGKNIMKQGFGILIQRYGK